MGIGSIKNALAGLVKQAGQKTAEVGTAIARAPVLSARLTEVNSKLAGLKGWGPEVKAQRTQLEAQRSGIQEEIKANEKVFPNRQDVIKNIR